MFSNTSNTLPTTTTLGLVLVHRSRSQPSTGVCLKNGAAWGGGIAVQCSLVAAWPPSHTQCSNSDKYFLCVFIIVSCYNVIIVVFNKKVCEQLLMFSLVINDNFGQYWPKVCRPTNSKLGAVLLCYCCGEYCPNNPQSKHCGSVAEFWILWLQKFGKV